MKEECLYTVREATSLVSDSMHYKTIYDWILKVERYTPKVFLRAIDKEHPRFVYGEPKAQLLINPKEIEQFQKLLMLRKQGVPLQLAIFQVFLRPEDYRFLQDNEWDYQELKAKVIRDYKNKA
ncbi:TPA: hypothetical protein ACGBG5_003483 [Enterococcus faecalis]